MRLPQVPAASPAAPAATATEVPASAPVAQAAEEGMLASAPESAIADWAKADSEMQCYDKHDKECDCTPPPPPPKEVC